MGMRRTTLLATTVQAGEVGMEEEEGEEATSPDEETSGISS